MAADARDRDSALGEGVNTLFPDISRWQGAIDWNLFHPVAVVLKAGGADGGLYEDINFRAYSAAAEAHGIPWMAYYFCDPNGDPGVQAAHFHSIAGAKARVGDIESGSGDQRRFASVFTANLTAPILYTGLNHALVSNLQGICLLWVAAYGTVEPTIGHIFWQHTSSARYPGIAGNVDESIFHGTLDELFALFGGDFMTQAEVDEIKGNLIAVVNALHRGNTPIWDVVTAAMNNSANAVNALSDLKTEVDALKAALSAVQAGTPVAHTHPITANTGDPYK